MLLICLYSEIHRERIRNLDSELFFKKKGKAPPLGTSLEKSTSALSHS